MLAAWSPSKPTLKPQLISVDATQITVGLTSCGVSNGALITDYVLYMQEGVLGQFTEVGVYQQDQLEVTLDAATYNLVVGERYFFNYKLRNEEGESPSSDITEIALADYPSAPLAPVKDNTLSSFTSIHLNWNVVSDT